VLAAGLIAVGALAAGLIDQAPSVAIR